METVGSSVSKTSQYNRPVKLTDNNAHLELQKSV